MARPRRYFSPRRSRRSDLIVILLSAIILSIVAIRAFVQRTGEEDQRRKALLLLEQIYRMERAHFEQHGRYVPVDPDRNLDALRLSGITPYEFRVDLPDSVSFRATARLGPEGDRKEVWFLDQDHPTPTRAASD